MSCPVVITRHRLLFVSQFALVLDSSVKTYLCKKKKKTVCVVCRRATGKNREQQRRWGVAVMYVWVGKTDVEVIKRK